MIGIRTFRARRSALKGQGSEQAARLIYAVGKGTQRDIKPQCDLDVEFF